MTINVTRIRDIQFNLHRDAQSIAPSCNLYWKTVNHANWGGGSNNKTLSGEVWTFSGTAQFILCL